MGKFKIWQVGQGTPLKLAESNVGLEKNLEGWIEADPSLLPGELEIISRQMIVDGGRLDLLALDPLGRFVVIEVKAGALLSDTITQAMYYAAQLDKYSYDTLASKIHSYPAGNKKDLKSLLLERGLSENDFEKNREVLIYLVGTQSTSGIETMLDYMANKFHVPLTVVTFDVFQLGNDERILVRGISEAESTVAGKTIKAQRSSADTGKVCALADKTGVGQEFRRILEESQKLGLYPRPYARSIMFTHPNHKTRMLFTVWADQKPLKAYVGYDAFVEFYPITAEQVAAALGPSGWRRLEKEQVQQLVAGLARMLSPVVSVG